MKCLVVQAISITPIISFSNIAQTGILANQKYSKTNIITTPFSCKSDVKPNRCLFASSSSNNNKKTNVQFEIQELKGNLQAISKARIPPRNLTSEKRTELASYLRTILEVSPSPIPLRSLGDNNASALHGSWRLGFTSSFGSDGVDGGKDVANLQQDLPKEAELFLTFYPDYKCDYTLSFSKRVFLLQKLIAKSSYIVDCSPVNPGLVSIVYQNIVSDMMGIKGLKVGLFGMLKGRVTYVDTVWFDGDIWVERTYSQEGEEVFNIYVRLDDEDDIWNGGINL